MPSRRRSPATRRPPLPPLLRIPAQSRLHAASLRSLLAFGASASDEDAISGLVVALRHEAEALARAFEGSRETLYLANIFAGFQRRLACVQELRAREINGRVRLGGGR